MGTENGLKLAGVSNVTAQAIGSEARRLRVYRNDTPPLPFKRRMSAPAMLSAILQAGGAREAVLFGFSDKPSLLASIAGEGFALMPEPAVIPLLPKHVHALISARGPIILTSSSYETFLSSNGNVAPELFKCIAPLKVGSKLVGIVG